MLKIGGVRDKAVMCRYLMTNDVRSDEMFLKLKFVNLLLKKAILNNLK